jgi:O-acetyl-ADP-ribose deacetylase (regulator of RNase III)
MQGDITALDVDAVLTFIPETLEYRGALNQAIHDAAGQAMDDFVLDHIYKPKPGDVYAVPGFNLPADHILFGITPDWRTDFERNDRDLLNCVRAAMMQARAMELESLAIPLVASGKHGFPKPRAARLIVKAVMERLSEEIGQIVFVGLTPEDAALWQERLTKVGWSA